MVPRDSLKEQLSLQARLPLPHPRTRGRQTLQRGASLTSVETVNGHFSLQVPAATTLGLRRPRAAPAPRASLPVRRSRAGTPQRAALVALKSPPPLPASQPASSLPEYRRAAVLWF